MSERGMCKRDDILALQADDAHMLHEVLLIVLSLGRCVVCLNEGVGVHKDGPAASCKSVSPEGSPL